MKYMVSMKSFKGIWHNEYFLEESSAKNWANEQWKGGAMIVELYVQERPNTRKAPGSYRLIKSVKRSKNEAKAVREMYLTGAMKRFQDENYEPDFSQIYGNYKH